MRVSDERLNELIEAPADYREYRDALLDLRDARAELRSLRAGIDELTEVVAELSSVWPARTEEPSRAV